MKKGRLSVPPPLKPGVGDFPGSWTKEVCAEPVATSQEALLYLHGWNNEHLSRKYFYLMRCFSATASSWPNQLTPLVSTSAFVFFQYLAVGFGSPRVLVGCTKELYFGFCQTLFLVSWCSMSLSIGKFTLAPMSDTAVMEPGPWAPWDVLPGVILR